MNKKNLERKEVRLAIPQVIGLLGLTLGSIAAAFCLGFFAGRSMSFEREISSYIASLPKLPVSGAALSEEAGDKIISEVYAKLTEQEAAKANELAKKPAAEAGENAMPELASIPDAEDVPAQAENTDDSQGSLLSDAKEEARIAESASNAEGDSATSLTLGAALAEHTEKPAVPTPIFTPQPTATPKAKVTEISKKEKEKLEKEKLEKEKAEAAKKREEAMSAQKSLSGGWYAQVAAPKKIEDAQALARALKASGFAVSTETAEVRGEKYYRILVGPESSKSQADILLRQLKRESSVKGEPFLRMVK